MKYTNTAMQYHSRVYWYFVVGIVCLCSGESFLFLYNELWRIFYV